MGVSAADADPTVFQPPPPPPADAGPVGGSTGATEPVSGPAPAPAPAAPAAPVDSFQPSPTNTTQPASRYAAAGPEVEKELAKNREAIDEDFKAKDDPAKNFFDLATKSQERADLLGKVIDKSPDGSRKTRLNQERAGFDDLSRARFAEYKYDEKRQVQLKALPPEQQKTFQAGFDRFEKEEAKRAAEKAAQPVSPEQKRKDELLETVSKAPTKLLNLSSEAHRDPAKALDYAKVWNEADSAHRELGDGPSDKAWYDAKRDVLDGALRRPGLGDELRGKLQDERDQTDALDAKDRIKELDKEIADINSGKKFGDPKLREQLKGMYQDRIDRVEGKPPGAGYQVQRKQLDEQRADIDKQLAELQPKGAPAQGTGQGQGQGGAQDTGPSLKLKQLEKEKAELAAKSDKLDRNHRDNLTDYGRKQAEKASAEPQKALDGLQQKRADLDKQLQDPMLEPGKKAELEKQRAGLDAEMTKARGDIQKAEQQAMDKARDLAKKSSGADELFKQSNAFRDQISKEEERSGLPEKRLELDKAKEAEKFAEQRLERAKKDQKQFAAGNLSQTINGKPVPNKQFGAELDSKVDGYEKDLAGYKARTARAQANVTSAEVGVKDLEAQRRTKYAQGTAAEIGPERMGERLGRSGLPVDLESGLLSKDPAVKEAAADKAATFIQDRLGPQSKAELRELGKKFGFEPHDSKDLYHKAKLAQDADQDLQKTKADAVRFGQEADKLEADAKARGSQLPPLPTPVPPDKRILEGVKPPEKQAAPPAAPAPAPAGQPAQPAQAKPKQERDPINPALSPEDRAHLERQQKEITDALEPLAKRLANGDPGSTPPPPAQGGTPFSGDDSKGSDPLKDAAHGLLKKALEDPDIVHRLVQGERIAYGLFSQAAGFVGGLYELGEMGVKGIADVVKDPEAAADKAWKGIKYAAENPDKVLKDAWDGGVKIAKGLKDAVVKSYEKDPLEFAGRAAFEALAFFIPGAGEANAAKNAANAGGKAVEVLRAGEKGVEVARAGEKAVEVANAGEKGVEVLRPGTKAYDEVLKGAEAKEELARRLRDSLPGGRSDNSIVPKGGRTMTGAGDMPPEQISRQIARLEKEAVADRAKLAEANKLARGTVPEIGAEAEKTAAKLTPEEFSKKVMDYPEDLSKKFTNGEIESTRVYLGNEVRGNPIDPKAKFAQRDLIDGLDDLAAKGWVGPDGKVFPPGETGKLNFQHINGELRGTMKDPLTPGQADRVKMVVERMDSMMDKSRLAEPTTVYRVNRKASYTTPDAKGMLPADKGFMSTGRTPQLGFAGDAEKAKQSVLQIIELPKGQRAVDMDALTRYYGDVESFRGRMPHGVPGKTPFGENELLLPRGTKLQVVDQWIDPATGLTIQRARVVPEGQSWFGMGNGVGGKATDPVTSSVKRLGNGGGPGPAARAGDLGPPVPGVPLDVVPRPKRPPADPPK